MTRIKSRKRDFQTNLPWSAISVLISALQYIRHLAKLLITPSHNLHCKLGTNDARHNGGLYRQPMGTYHHPSQQYHSRPLGASIPQKMRSQKKLSSKLLKTVKEWCQAPTALQLPYLLVSQKIPNNLSFSKNMHCLYYLLPRLCDTELISDIRSPTRFPTIPNQTKKHQSFVFGPCL